MIRSLLAASIAVLVANAAVAATATYVIDPNHTFARFSYDHAGFSAQQSRFNATSGTVILDSASKTGSVDVTIDTKSVDTGSKLFDGHIQGADFLDTAQFPVASFKSKAVKFEGEKPVLVEGDLTIKGITKPVTLTLSSFTNRPNMQRKDTIGANATAHIKRSDFNAGKFAPAIGDDVTLTIALEATVQ